MNHGDLRRVRVIVSGRVQGVFFRVSAAEHANELGVTGTVRNLPDGRVEVVAEGPPAVVESMVAFCRTGPPSARVTNVELEELEPTGEARGFAVH